jgi:hypothetical protein
VIAAPPLFDGAVKLTVTWAFPRTPITPVGAAGTVTGVTADDGALGALVPTMFLAVTVNV